jgi:membrane carboxypeptidase/penicillin-binding protein PbpC
MVLAEECGDSFRAVTKRRILEDMLGKVGEQAGGEWKVLVVDNTTVKVRARVGSNRTLPS